MRREKMRCIFLSSLAVVLLFPSLAYADAALPLIFLTLPGMALALVPVIAVESYVLFTVVGLFPYGFCSGNCSWVVIFVANVVSTLIGIPVTWLLLGPLAKFPQHRIPGVLWFMPLDGVKYPKDWMVPAACLLLLVPYFFVSWFIEYKVAIHMREWLDPQKVVYGMFVANLVSYLMLASIVLGWLIGEVLLGLRASHIRFLSLSRLKHQVLSHTLMESEALEREVINENHDMQWTQDSIQQAEIVPGRS